MFLNQNLNLEQKEAFLKMANEFAAVDKTLDKEEKNLLQFIVDEMIVNEESLYLRELIGEKPENKENLLNKFDTSSAKKTVILQLIILGYVDNDFCHKENDYINEIAQKFDIEQDEIDKMKAWVPKQLKHVQEIEKLWKN